MSNTFIREAALSDYAAIQFLYKEIDNQHHDALPNLFKPSNEIERPIQQFEEELNNESLEILVATKNNIIVGFLQFEIKKAEHPNIKSYQYGFISELVVDSKFKRKGIGKLLLNKSHMWFQKKGITEINLMVFDFNKEAIAFYKNLGYFNKHITMTSYLGNHENS